MKRFIITAYLENGDAWETVRHTKEGLDSVIKDIVADDNVLKFSVDDKVDTIL